MTAGEAGQLFLSPYNFVRGASIDHPSFTLEESGIDALRCYSYLRSRRDEVPEQ